MKVGKHREWVQWEEKAEFTTSTAGWWPWRCRSVSELPHAGNDGIQPPEPHQSSIRLRPGRVPFLSLHVPAFDLGISKRAAGGIANIALHSAAVQ
jgi:hypothetical protein